MSKNASSEEPRLEKLGLSVLAKIETRSRARRLALGSSWVVTRFVGSMQFRLTRRNEFYIGDLGSTLSDEYDPLDSFFVLTRNDMLIAIDLFHPDHTRDALFSHDFD